ncbi:MAG: hypothetical protein U0840_30960 [Gemmataceae bacterium]
MKPFAALLLGAALFWGLVAIPAKWILGGELTYVYSGTALLLCLVPAALTLLWAEFAFRGDPQSLPMVVLGSTGVRLFGVLVVAYLIYQNVPLFRQENGFLYWLVVCYLFTLALEMYLLLSNRTRRENSV